MSRIISLFLLIVTIIFCAEASSVSRFGPKRYDRTTGKPNTCQDNFVLKQGATAPFTLTVTNGAPNGSNRVSSGTVTINGVVIIKQSDLNQQVGSLQRVISLNANNSIEVDLSSTPGTFFVSAADLKARLQVPRRDAPGSFTIPRRAGRAHPARTFCSMCRTHSGNPELPMINFVRTLAGRGRTFVDVGSHIGFYTMGLAPGFSKVVAFEPSKFQYGWLTRNRALNDYTHVACEHVALGDTRGEATLKRLELRKAA